MANDLKKAGSKSMVFETNRSNNYLWKSKQKQNRKELCFPSKKKPKTKPKSSQNSCEWAVTSVTRHQFQGVANDLFNWTVGMKIDLQKKKVGRVTPLEGSEINVTVINLENVVRILRRYCLIHTFLHQLCGLNVEVFN